jgi:hypothetical protein
VRARAAEVSNPRTAASMTRDYITVSQSILASLVSIAICLLFAFQQAFHDCCTPRYLGGLVREPLRKISVILLHNVEHRFLGTIAMVSGK